MKCRKSKIFEHSRKAQGLSINTIIIVALALVVLVALIAIFTGKLGNFGKGTMDCEKTYNGRCLVECDGINEIEQTLARCFDDDTGKIDSSRVCCVEIHSGQVNE